jgi:FkbM family methyltransferase
MVPVIREKLVDLGINIYIEFLGIFGSSFYKYKYRNHIFFFDRTKSESFRFFRKKLTNGKTSEGIPLTLFENIDVDLMIDIGAHFGLYSVIMGVLNPNTKLHCFEPNEQNRQILRKNLQQNDVDSNTYSEVVSGENGSIPFFESQSNSHSVSHGTSKPVEQSTETVKSSVKASEFINNHGVSSTFLKIDAEGEEYAILQDLFENTNCEYIEGIVEVHPMKLGDRNTSDIICLFEEHCDSYEYISDTTPNQEFSFPAYHFKVDERI